MLSSVLCRFNVLERLPFWLACFQAHVKRTWPWFTSISQPSSHFTLGKQNTSLHTCSHILTIHFLLSLTAVANLNATQGQNSSLVLLLQSTVWYENFGKRSQFCLPLYANEKQASGHLVITLITRILTTSFSLSQSTVSALTYKPLARHIPLWWVQTNVWIKHYSPFPFPHKQPGCSASIVCLTWNSTVFLFWDWTKR